MSEIHERAKLPPRLRAISDTLDEWLVRMHGIFSGWAYPEEFEDWLKGHGYIVLPVEAQAALEAAKRLKMAAAATLPDETYFLQYCRDLIAAVTKFEEMEKKK